MQAEMIECMRCGRTQGKTGTDFCQMSGLLKHDGLEARALQCQRDGQTADSAAHDADAYCFHDGYSA